VAAVFGGGPPCLRVRGWASGESARQPTHNRSRSPRCGALQAAKRHLRLRISLFLSLFATKALQGCAGLSSFDCCRGWWELQERLRWCTLVFFLAVHLVKDYINGGSMNCVGAPSYFSLFFQIFLPVISSFLLRICEQVEEEAFIRSSFLPSFLPVFASRLLATERSFPMSRSQG
jgi:hypothetical protein